MKKICIILLCTCLFLTLFAGCEKKPDTELTPASTTVKLMDALKQLDFAEASKYTDIRKFFEFNEDGTISEGTRRFATVFLSKLDYTLQKQTEVDAETSLITLEITTVDMTPVMESFVSNLMMSTIKNEMDGVILTEEQTEANALQIFDEIIAGASFPTITTTVEVQVSKINGQWVVYATEPFAEAISGGMQKATENANKLLKLSN